MYRTVRLRLWRWRILIVAWLPSAAEELALRVLHQLPRGMAWEEQPQLELELEVHRVAVPTPPPLAAHPLPQQAVCRLEGAGLDYGVER